MTTSSPARFAILTARARKEQMYLLYPPFQSSRAVVHPKHRSHSSFQPNLKVNCPSIFQTHICFYYLLTEKSWYFLSLKCDEFLLIPGLITKVEICSTSITVYISQSGQVNQIQNKTCLPYLHFTFSFVQNVAPASRLSYSGICERHFLPTFLIGGRRPATGFSPKNLFSAHNRNPRSLYKNAHFYVQYNTLYSLIFR